MPKLVSDQPNAKFPALIADQTLAPELIANAATYMESMLRSNSDQANDLPVGTSKRLLSRSEASALLTAVGIPTAVSTLAKLACTGIGAPPMRRIGSRRIAYELVPLLDWAVSRISPQLSSTSNVPLDDDVRRD